MKDHEIIATIEKALDSADGGQRERVEAWLRLRLGASGLTMQPAPKPAETPAPQPFEPIIPMVKTTDEILRELLEQMKRNQPFAPSLPFLPYGPPGIIGEPWWGVVPPTVWPNEITCRNDSTITIDANTPAVASGVVSLTP